MSELSKQNPGERIQLTVDTTEYELSQNSPEELTGLEHVLKELLQRVHKLQGKPDSDPLQETPAKDPVKNDLPDDPVGEVIIQDFKKMQAMSPRKTSGWTSVGMPDKVDDKHI
jgi:hypothetical protein